MCYMTARTTRDAFESQLRDATAALQAIPHVGAGPMGLTPDHAKREPGYREARQAVDTAFRALQRFNLWFARTYPAEIRADAARRRAALRDAE